MIYIKLAQSIKGHDMARIKEFHFFDSDDNEKTPMSVGFRYQVCSDSDSKYIELYNKFVTIDDKNVVKQLFEKRSSSNSFYDNICRIFLEYVLSMKLETGTLEIKWEWESGINK